MDGTERKPSTAEFQQHWKTLIRYTVSAAVHVIRPPAIGGEDWLCNSPAI